MIDISLTMVVQVLNFGVLMWLLNKVLFQKVVEYLDRRSEGIEVDLAEAKRLKKEATELKTEQETELQRARKEGTEIIRESRKQADEERSKLIEQAEQESQGIIENGKKSVDLEVRNARKSLQQDVADVAVDIAGKLLERSVTARDQGKIVKDVLKNFEKWN